MKELKVAPDIKLYEFLDNYFHFKISDLVPNNFLIGAFN